MIESLLIFDDPIPRDGPGQMALDELLLTRAGLPLLRRYRWAAPWVTFGYSQSLAATRAARPGARLVRRWTGGGLVDHDGDWTFALVVPRSSAFLEIRPADSYCLVHRAVAAVLAEAGQAPSLAGAAPASAPGACFAGAPAEHDVLDAAGAKLCGGAQRRTREGLLHQGSVQGVALPPDFLARLASRLSDEVGIFPPPPDLASVAHALAESKYATPAWNSRVP